MSAETTGAESIDAGRLGAQIAATNSQAIIPPPATSVEVTAATGYADVARQLLASGIGSPLPLPRGKKEEPPSGYTGAAGHAASAPDVEAWCEDRPGDNVCVRLADEVVGIDIDAYDGKVGWTTVNTAANYWGQLPRTVRSTSRNDGTSGIYLYRVPAGSRFASTMKAAGQGNHVEIIQHVYRYAIVAPSLHPEGRRYRWVLASGRDAPDGWVPALADLPTLPQAWLDGLRKKEPAAAPVGAPFTGAGSWSKYDGPPFDGLPLGRRDRARLFTQTVVDAELARLDVMRKAATPGRHNGDAWDAETHDVACQLLDLADSAWSPLTEADAVRLVHEHAPTDAGFPRSRIEAKISSARKRPSAGQGRPAPWEGEPEPASASASGRTSTSAPASEKGKEPEETTGARRVVKFVEEHYRLHVTPGNEPFAVPVAGAQLPVMLGERGGRLRDAVTAGLYNTEKGVPSAKATDNAFRVVMAHARRSEQVTPLHLRVAEHAGGLVLDLAQPNSARCVLIRPGVAWEVVENPPEGVLFRRSAATRALPNPERGGTLEPLRELLGFTSEDPRWHLMRGWLVAAAMPSIPRPLLLLVGQPGCAKTTRARLALSVLDPREELGSSFGRNITDDQVKAQSRYLVGYDNLHTVSDAISDHICRLVTGDEIDRRQLYTDGDVSTISYRRTGALTALTVPAMRADALERLIVMAVDRIPEKGRLSESVLRGAFAANHGGILGGLCTALAATLERLPAARIADRPRPRMADYSDVLAAYDDAAEKAYITAATTAMVDAAEADPFVSAVRTWLASVGGAWSGKPTDAWRLAHRHLESHDGRASQMPWWPKDARGFTAALTVSAEPLRAVGISREDRKSNGARVLVLSTEPPPPNRDAGRDA